MPLRNLATDLNVRLLGQSFLIQLVAAIGFWMEVDAVLLNNGMISGRSGDFTNQIHPVASGFQQRSHRIWVVNSNLRSATPVDADKAVFLKP